MLIVSWFLRIIALLVAVSSIFLYFQINGILAKQNQSITELNQEVKKAQDEKNDFDNRRVQAESRLRNTEATLGVAQRDVSSRIETQRRLESTISELNSSLTSLRSENTGHKERIATLEREIISTKSNSQEDELRNRLEERNRNIDQLSAALAEREKERDTFKAQLEEIQKQVAAEKTPATIVTSGSTIIGEVLRTDAENQLVVINLGAEQNIQPNQQLLTFKEGSNASFTLEVTSVAPAYSITRVVSRSGTRNSTPGTGDMVTRF